MSFSLQITPVLTPVNHWKGRDGHRVKAIVLHITDGDTADGALGWFRNSESQASAHYVVDRNGAIFQSVDEADTAWANGRLTKPDMTNPLIRRWLDLGINPNKETISIEVVGRPNQGWTTRQLAVVEYLIYHLATKHQITVGPDTILGHHQIDSVTRSRCPSLTPDQWRRLRKIDEPDDDEKLETAYQANPAGYGDKRYSAFLTTNWHTGKVLRTANALLATDGRNLAIAKAGYILDDWEQAAQSAGVLNKL